MFFPALYYSGVNKNEKGKPQDHFMYLSWFLWSVGYRWTNKVAYMAREEELKLALRKQAAKNANAKAGQGKGRRKK